MRQHVLDWVTFIWLVHARNLLWLSLDQWLIRCLIKGYGTSTIATWRYSVDNYYLITNFSRTRQKIRPQTATKLSYRGTYVARLKMQMSISGRANAKLETNCQPISWRCTWLQWKFLLNEPGIAVDPTPIVCITECSYPAKIETETPHFSVIKAKFIHKVHGMGMSSLGLHTSSLPFLKPQQIPLASAMYGSYLGTFTS